MADRSPVEFQFGGRLSLDLTWTVRYRAVLPTELLNGPDELRWWLEAARLPAPSAPTPPDLDAARELREAIYRAAVAVIDGARIDPADRARINESATPPPPFPQLDQDSVRSFTAPAGGEASAALSAIARDAIELLAADDGRLRRCSGPLCSLLFHDNSRPGTRRWCTTARCGNKVNTRAYRERRREHD